MSTERLRDHLPVSTALTVATVLAGPVVLFVAIDYVETVEAALFVLFVTGTMFYVGVVAAFAGPPATEE